MASVAQAGVGTMLRSWRERRRMTQLELALDAGTSARHLSFVETGRSKPGREMLLRVLARLEVPFRERNELLLAAGYAPAFPERSLEDPELEPFRDAVELILKGHEPYPAIAVDRSWNLVAVNSVVSGLVAGLDLDPTLLEPPVNAVRASLHPRGLAPLIVNLDGWRAFFRDRLERQYALTGNEDLVELIDELAALSADGDGSSTDPAATIGPLRLRGPGGEELAFVAMFAGFDMPFEVTTSELAIELLFPADTDTARAMRG